MGIDGAAPAHATKTEGGSNEGAQQVSRHRFLTTAARSTVALAAGAAVASQVGAVAEAASRLRRAPLATTTIKLSVWGDVQDMGAYQAIIKDFEAAQHEIKVVAEQWTIDNYYTKLQTTMAAGTVPDLVYFQPWTWQPYAIAGALRPLDDLIARDRARIPDIWPNALSAQFKWNGHVYVAPSDAGPMVIYYNKEMFDRARVPYPKEGWTLDDFVRTARELTITKGGKTVQYGYQANYGGDAYFRNLGWMRLHGALESTPIVKPRKANFSDPRVTQGLQLQWADMPNKLRSSMPIGALLSGGGTNGNYLYGIQNGLVAMKLEGSWFMPQLVGPLATKKGGVPFDVVSAPRVGNQWHTPLALDGHAIPAQSKNAEAAWEFLKHVWSDQGQRHIAAGGRTCNSADAIAKIWLPSARKLYGFTNDAAWLKAVSHGEVTVVGGVSPNDIGLKGGFNAASDAVGNGSQTAGQAFASVNRQVQTLYDAWWNSHPNG